MNFGLYMAAARIKAGLTLREVAARLGITAAYLCDVEKGKRNALDLDKLRKFALATDMTREETNRLFDLAGENRGDVAPDVSEYLTENTYLFSALRTARSLNAGPGDWEAMLEDLKRRKDV